MDSGNKSGSVAQFTSALIWSVALYSTKDISITLHLSQLGWTQLSTTCWNSPTISFFCPFISPLLGPLSHWGEFFLRICCPICVNFLTCTQCHLLISKVAMSFLRISTVLSSFYFPAHWLRLNIHIYFLFQIDRAMKRIHVWRRLG